MDAFSSSDREMEPDLQVLVLKNRLDELTLLKKWIAQYGCTLKISPRDVFRLELVLLEVVANIIEYAYSDIDEHEIVVALQHWKNIVKVQIQDDGLAFDLLQQPPIELPDRLEKAREGGLGIPLIRYYTDECHYSRADRKNVLTLIIRDSK